MNNKFFHNMNDLQSLRFPFLGIRENGETFEYVLLDVSPDKATIAIYKWLVNRITLNLKEKVELFIPSLISKEDKLRNQSDGTIISSKRESDDTHLYEVHFSKSLTLAPAAHGSLDQYFQHLPSESPLNDMLLQLIKDCSILKQGLLIYLNHFSAYFSRIVKKTSSDYYKIKEVMFNDISKQIQLNQSTLNELYELCKINIKTTTHIPIFLNLEELREMMESEISLDLFLVAFASEDSRLALQSLLKDTHYDDEIQFKYKYINYLVIIKNLEKRLYSNYNQIVLIYLKSI